MNIISDIVNLKYNFLVKVYTKLSLKGLIVLKSLSDKF